MKFRFFLIVSFFIQAIVFETADVGAVEYYENDILENEVAAIYGKACEKFKPKEPKSSARVRVIDKACFAAIESMSMLDDARRFQKSEDFNLMVYNLIDNALEDLAVRTIVQNDKDICVEVTGYVSKNMAQDELNKLPKAPDIDPKTKKELSSFDKDFGKKERLPQEKSDNLVPEPQPQNNTARVWIAPVEFYNNTSSQQFTQIIAQKLAENPNILLTQEKSDADYRLKPSILRAKIDPVNSSTNRLQMVVSLELENRDGERISSEHQNRFVLFSTQDDEQEVALKLMTKLLINACEKIQKKLEKYTQGISHSSSLQDAILTPPQK